jgi:hypothetical protein
MITARVIAITGLVAFAAGCSSSKATHARKVQQARDAAKVEAAHEAARPQPAVALYIQDATFRFGQVWQRFLEQYGDRLPTGSRVVAVIDVTREGQLAGLRFEQPTPNADVLERGIESALAATQFDPFTDEMQRELGQTAHVEIRIPITVR